MARRTRRHPPLEGEGRRARRSEAKTSEPGWGESEGEKVEFGIHPTLPAFTALRLLRRATLPLQAGLSHLEIPESDPGLGPSGSRLPPQGTTLSVPIRRIAPGTNQNRNANGLWDGARSSSRKAPFDRHFFSNAIPLPWRGRVAPSLRSHRRSHPVRFHSNDEAAR